MPRKKHVKDEYEKQLQLFHKSSARHVLVVEADMSEDMKRRAFGLADKLRICGNKLTAKMEASMDQLFRTKKYRALRKNYKRLSAYLEQHEGDKKAEAALKAVTAEMSAMQKAYHVTWDDARKYMMYLKDQAGVSSVFALTRAEDVWSGVEKVLFGKAKKLHFKKRGDLPELRAKQNKVAIIFLVEDNRLRFRCSDIGKEAFCAKSLDKFQQSEVASIVKYMNNPKANDRYAITAMKTTGKIVDTFRPCYASLVCKEIRGKLRVFIHITIEGKAHQQFKADGVTPRHTYGTGRVGIDIGTQTIAYTSDKEVGLKNLSERGMTISHAERQERLLRRKMDRSRRATNPDNYNEDGTIKKGRKKWVKSHRYKKLQMAFRELCRKNAESRSLAIKEEVNHIRSLGNVVITEPPNFKALQKRAKPEEKPAEDGSAPQKNKRRKRFGKSLRSRCPGTFQAALKSKFEVTGGSYHEVDKLFRASQYEHTTGEYIKKKLSQRMFTLTHGPLVQRDWYSSFLLYNAAADFSAPNRASCLATFDRMHKASIDMIDNIKKAGIHVLNSGIRS